MVLYGLKNCDSCRKAMKTLGDVTFRDVRADGVPAETLSQAYEKFGQNLINTRSATWRGLDEPTRAMDPIALLSAHPTVMKRPLIDAGGTLHLGWSAEVAAALGA